MPTIFPLAAFWFLYMSSMGIFYPFYALYLRENAGLTGTEIGLVYATIPLVSLFAPTLWGRAADRSLSGAAILALAVAGTGLAEMLIAGVRGFAAIVAATAVVAAFATAVIPLGVSVSLSALGAEGHAAFGRVRMWGTVGYLILVISFPRILDAFQSLRGLTPTPEGPSEPGLELMFLAAGGLCLTAAVVARRITDREPPADVAIRGDWKALFRHGPFLRMLAFSFTAYLFLQGPMNFFPAWVRSRGGGLDMLSTMWIVMLVPEIPLVALSGAGFRRLGPRGLLATGVIAGGVRWVICGVSESLWILLPVQMLHGVVVTGLLIGGPLYIDAAVPSRLRSTAQGLLAMAGVGVGGIVSSLGTGWLLDGFGVDAPYVIGGLGAVLLGLLTAVVLPAPARPR